MSMNPDRKREQLRLFLKRANDGMAVLMAKPESIEREAVRQILQDDIDSAVSEIERLNVLARTWTHAKDPNDKRIYREN